MTDAIIVTGVFGSGKTTTINKLIPGVQLRNKRLVTIVNEIGQLNTDSARLQANSDEVIGYTSGCVCCERREDLERTLKGIDLARYDTLIIEPTGAANPLEIVSTILEQPNVELAHVLALAPLKHLDNVRVKTSFIAGLQLASTIGLTWTQGASEQNRADFERYAKENRLSAPVIAIGDGFSYDTLVAQPRWKTNSLMSVESGHEHYKSTVRPINQDCSLEMILGSLQGLARRGVDRAKGVLPAYGKSFDIVRTDLAINDYSGPEVMGYIVMMDERKLPLEVIAAITAGSEELSVAVETATKDDLLRLFTHYFERTAQTAPSVKGVVQANFEATDEAYTVAKVILQKHKDANPMKLALAPYIDIRLKGLRELDWSKQPNKAYVGVMLGSFVAQMLGEHDGIRFDELTSPDQLRQIKKAMPHYFAHLSRFRETDVEQVANADGYSRFFVRMAKQATSYAAQNGIAIAVRNMAERYEMIGKNEIAQSWRSLHA